MFDKIKKNILPETENQYEPPSHTSPTAVARQLTPLATQESFHLTAILFDLAERGFLTISQQQEDVIFQRTDKPTAKLAFLYERLFLTDLFGMTGYMPFKQAGPRLVGMRRTLDTQIAKELPKFERKQLAHWRGFKRYLEKAESVKDPALFGRYLPYAIAFGVDINWGAKFLDSVKEALPHWYSTLDSKQNVIEVLRISQTMSHILEKTAIGVSIPFDEQLAASGQHPLGQGVLVMTMPAGGM